MTEAVLFAFVLAWCKGFKWKVFNLFKHWSVYPIAFTCLLHIYIIYLMLHGEYWFIIYGGYIKTFSILFYLALALKYDLFNVSLFSKFKTEKAPLLTTITSPVAIGVLCIGIGSILNVIAVRFNNFKMPVFPNVSLETGYSKTDMFDKMLLYNDYHVFGNSETSLIFLTDIFDFFYSIMSIGDLITRMFVVLIIYCSIKECNKYKYKNNR